MDDISSHLIAGALDITFDTPDATTGEPLPGRDEFEKLESELERLSGRHASSTARPPAAPAPAAPASATEVRRSSGRAPSVSAPALVDTSGMTPAERTLADLVAAKVSALEAVVARHGAATAALNEERARVSRALAAAEDEGRALARERAELRAAREADAARAEAWRLEEHSRMERERRVAVRQARAAATAAAALPDRAERAELEGLHSTVASLKAELAASESRYRGTVERHRSIAARAEARITALEAQVNAYEAERINAVFGAKAALPAQPAGGRSRTGVSTRGAAISSRQPAASALRSADTEGNALWTAGGGGDAVGGKWGYASSHATKAAASAGVGSGQQLHALLQRGPVDGWVSAEGFHAPKEDAAAQTVEGGDRGGSELEEGYQSWVAPKSVVSTSIDDTSFAQEQLEKRANSSSSSSMSLLDALADQEGSQAVEAAEAPKELSGRDAGRTREGVHAPSAPQRLHAIRPLEQPTSSHLAGIAVVARELLGSGGAGAVPASETSAPMLAAAPASVAPLTCAPSESASISSSSGGGVQAGRAAPRSLGGPPSLSAPPLRPLAWDVAVTDALPLSAASIVAATSPDQLHRHAPPLPVTALPAPPPPAPSTIPTLLLAPAAAVALSRQFLAHLARRTPPSALALGVAAETPSVPVIATRSLANGKSEATYGDGTRLVRFANGTEREQRGALAIVRFANGDIKRSLPSGVEAYFYATAGTLQTTYPPTPDGAAPGYDVFEFASGQVELHWGGGGKEVVFSDGTAKGGEASPPGGR